MLSRILGKVENADQLETAFQVYDGVRRPRAQAMVQESLDVMVQYYLIHPDFGHDLQKITDEANRRLPLIWWHDLEADVQEAEERFERLKAVSKSSPEIRNSSVEGKVSSSGLSSLLGSCLEFFRRLI